eukprot:3002061-Pleurochrysis_carterae.AAC.1
MFFGSEGGCFTALFGKKCRYSHRFPNSVRMCAMRERCLRMGACKHRHREWQDWREAEAFYRRVGPYATRQADDDYDDDCGRGFLAAEDATREQRSEWYHEHLRENRMYEGLYEKVCGVISEEEEASVTDPVALAQRYRRYGRAYKMMAKWGFSVGGGMGKTLQGDATPVVNGGKRMKRRHGSVPTQSVVPWLGLGAPLPAKPVPDHMIELREDGVLKANGNEFKQHGVKKWLPLKQSFVCARQSENGMVNRPSAGTLAPRAFSAGRIEDLLSLARDADARAREQANQMNHSDVAAADAGGGGGGGDDDDGDDDDDDVVDDDDGVICVD